MLIKLTRTSIKGEGEYPVWINTNHIIAVEPCENYTHVRTTGYTYFIKETPDQIDNQWLNRKHNA